MGRVAWLAGAMGIAAWRVRDEIEDYAVSAALGQQFQGGRLLATGTRAPLATGLPSLDGLHEVGLSDRVLAGLWRHGPPGSVFAVTSTAESVHLGADLAVVDQHRRLVVAYQAKVVTSLSGSMFSLKSGLSAAQAGLLHRRRIDVDGVAYRMRGRLALYQCEIPFAPPRAPRAGHHVTTWRSLAGAAPPVSAASLGQTYYDAMMRFGASSFGVMTSVAPRIAANTIHQTTAWPWEFDVLRHFVGRPHSGGWPDNWSGAPARRPTGLSARHLDEDDEGEVSQELQEKRLGFSYGLASALNGEERGNLTVAFI